MPRVDPLQPSFNAGEFSPLMIARSDFGKHAVALRKAENIIGLSQGGAMRRPGTRFIVELKSSAAKGALIPFEFSTTQAYVLEAGNLFFRFLRNQGQIVSQDITASITNGTFDSGITNWSDRSAGTGAISHDSTNNRLSLDSGGSEATNQAHAEQQVTNSSAIEHILRFTVFGVASDSIKLRIGTASQGTQIVNDLSLGVGYHSIAFTATAADFFVQFIYDKPNIAKSVTIDDISLIDNSAVELTTPYTTAQLPDLRWVQSADTLYILHVSHPVMKLLRRGHTSWSLEEVNWLEGPFLAENSTATTLNPGATTGEARSLAASSIVGINDDTGFQSTDVGRLVRYSTNSTDWGYAIITGVTDTTNATIDVLRTLPAATAQTGWALGAWSGTTGYPSVGTFHEQRLCLANTTQDPDKFWLSQSGDFENMRPDSGSPAETQDDDALDYRISSDQVNAIRWMKSGVKLMIGTTGGEWIAQSDGPILKPTDIDVKQQTSIKSAAIAPVQVDNAVIFVQRGKRQVREYAFNFEADGFRSPDLTILSGQITKSRVSRLVYAPAPHSLVLALREDGRLAVQTYKREQDVLGWQRWVAGGAFSSGISVIEDVAVIPGNNGQGQVKNSEERDEIWVIVKRTINGATKRYIEVFEQDFEGPDRNNYLTPASYETALLTEMEDMYYADSILTYDSTATTTITGLTHLEGETVKVLADGAVHPDETVSSGTITLDNSASVVQVGLGYHHDIDFMRLDAGNPAGSALAKDKVIQNVPLILHETGALAIGADRDDLKKESLREVSDAMDTAVPLFTGSFEAEIEGDYIPDPRVIIRQNDPTPFTLLAVVPEVQVSSS